jgi:hypothetical protein
VISWIWAIPSQLQMILLSHNKPWSVTSSPCLCNTKPQIYFAPSKTHHKFWEQSLPIFELPINHHHYETHEDCRSLIRVNWYDLWQVSWTRKNQHVSIHTCHFPLQALLHNFSQPQFLEHSQQTTTLIEITNASTNFLKILHRTLRGVSTCH